MKVDISNENVLMIIPESGFEKLALITWHSATVGLKTKFAEISVDDGEEFEALLIANTQDGIDRLNDLELEDE